MKRNKALLKKAAKRIERVPESYYQGSFCQPSDEAPCGTAACLAGEIIICSAPTVEQGIKKLKGVMRRWEESGRWPGDVAANLAGLTHEEALRLFPATPDQWPTPFRQEYKRNKAAAAAGLLRHLAANVPATLEG